uniref:Amino acid transporter transmembrane domain-containing protein n=1 Tax=Opuntia streptacantha TaxID=393608 RepID=A0A7C9AJ79_OPUST
MLCHYSIRNPKTTFYPTHSGLNLSRKFHTLNLSFTLCPPTLAPNPHPLPSNTKSKPAFLFLKPPKNGAHSPINCLSREANEGSKLARKEEERSNKSFWAAVSLIIGTAVGPGMLGLPAANMRSGPLPSTIAILLSWVYVISSIILVAELSFATMKEDGVKEVSFTGLANKAFGAQFGAFVSLVYASLSFSLLVACVSGIGSIVSQWLPNLNTVTAHALFPLLFGSIIWFFPFHAIDSTNRFLCFGMLISIITLVGIGVSVARANLLASFATASWHISSILPAIPVTVLTLGFHVITPFICKIAGETVHEARKAILIGGVVPLIMVLSWNLIVLGLAGSANVPSSSSSVDPIKLLLSVQSSALYAVQGFAFTALATSFIGYAVSFPKQLIDTMELIFQKSDSKTELSAESSLRENGNVDVKDEVVQGMHTISRTLRGLISLVVLLVPIFVASFYPSTFSRALDFAGVYANCFLFGILPPAMAYVYKSQRKLSSSLPGGDVVLFLLFSIAVVLSIWH